MLKKNYQRQHEKNEMSKQILVYLRSCYLAQAGKTAPLRWFCVALFIVCMLASCASNRGIVEFGAYRDAYVSTAETGQFILDRLAIAERELHELKTEREVRERTPPQFMTKDIRFNPDEASFYSKAVDPPATAALRRALRAVQLYNDALYGLASGQTAEAMAANISRLSGVGASTAGELGGTVAAAAPVAVTGAAAVTTGAVAVNNVVRALEPLNAFAFRFKTRTEFRERLLGQYKTIDNILKTTRDSSKTIFDSLFAKMIDDRNNSFDDNGLLSENDKMKFKQTRELLSNWVILLDGSRLALTQAVMALEDTSNVGSVAGLTVTVTELGVAAREARINLAKTAN